MEIINILLPIITLLIGYYLGFNVRKNDEIPKIPTPKNVIERKKEERRERQEKDTLNQFLTNIDNYPNNQKDIKE